MVNFRLFFLGVITSILTSCSTSFPFLSKEKKDVQTSAIQPINPLLTHKKNVLGLVQIIAHSPSQAQKISVNLQSEQPDLGLAELLLYTGKNWEKSQPVAQLNSVSGKNHFSVDFPIRDTTQLWIVATTVQHPNLLNKIKIQSAQIQTNQGKINIAHFKNPAQRFGLTLRQKGQDGIACYRIPGLATTNSGTLIAVYDNRFDNCKDLQGHITVGMSRSTDGGQTWEQMKQIIDMGQWGGLPADQNGVGDPAVLVDKQTGTIWVVALWQHGSDKSKMVWWSSRPGMSETQTGQIVLVKSEDDGKTWSQPINITQQVKNPDWYLFFQGPGSGISLENGTIAFAAQYKDAQQIPHSSMIYSTDHGKTWKASQGIKKHTTEAQIVQLPSGEIMINARDDQNRLNAKIHDGKNGRSVYTTQNMGETWQMHPTSRQALKEPVCMASIISWKGKNKNWLFFSNPNHTKTRTNMTLKASWDSGNSWERLPQIEYHQAPCYGYSSLSVVEDKYIGILYEGSGDLYFQKIAIDEFTQ